MGLPQFEPQYRDSPLRLTERDLSIIRKVYRYRLMDSDQLRALFSPQVEEPAVQGEKTNEAITRRLQKLFHHGYLDRPKSQKALSVRYGNLPMIYALGDKGAKELSREYGLDIGNLNWRRKNDQLGHPYMAHRLMISRARACLEVALREKEKVELTRWDDGKKLDPGRGGVIPDGFFGLEFADRPEGENRAYFFLEADRSTTPHGRFFKKKILGYRRVKRSGIHREVYGISKFRVLTVTKSGQRKENLLESIRKKLEGRPVSKRDRARFLFACQKDYKLEDSSFLEEVFTDLTGKSASLLPTGYL